MKLENGTATVTQSVQSMDTSETTTQLNAITTQQASAAGIDVSGGSGHVLAGATINTDGQIILTGDPNGLSAGTLKFVKNLYMR